MSNKENHIDFLKLKKNLKKDFTKLKLVKIALLGDFSTQILHQALKGYGFELNLDFSIYEPGFNQIEQEILSENSGLYQFKPDFVIISYSAQKLYSGFCKVDQDARHNFADNHLEFAQSLIEAIAGRLSCPIIYSNFVEINDYVFGNYGNKQQSSFLYQIRKLNFKLMELAVGCNQLFINDVSSISNRFGQDYSLNARLFLSSELVFSFEFFAQIAKNITDIISPHIGFVRKCLILDLDNTLWGGEIGDDGLNKIQIGDIASGKAFHHVQLWAKELKERGVILAICSKNTESVAKEPFLSHPDMVLKLEDITVFIANWNSKAENIKLIQSILNIGFDSMVFIDDNPYERGLVKFALPEVCVPELPADPADYADYLKSINLFEIASYSKEDSERTSLYQDETKRVLQKLESKSETEYLINLNMVCTVNQVDSFNIPRVAQLLQRANQFNLRTIRYSEEELVKISNSGEYIPLCFLLKDSFGDYGLIASVILRKIHDSLFIDTWAMSCRILKRGMEEFIVNHIVSIAKVMGYHKIIGEFIPTAKNGIVKELYPGLKFKHENGKWVLNIKDNTPLTTFVQTT